MTYHPHPAAQAAAAQSGTPARDERLAAWAAVAMRLGHPQWDADELAAAYVEHADAEQNRDEVIVAWLGKKAREYRKTRTRQGTMQADVIDKMADKIRRGAARPNNLLGAPSPTPTPRRVLTDDEFQAAYIAARNALGHIRAHRIGGAGITDTIAGALASVGILTPPGAPDPDTCTAMFADPDGTWWQCQQEPGHDGDGHDAGDWGWPNTHPDAIPPHTDE